MTLRTLSLAAVAVLTLGAAACTQAETDTAEADVEAAGDRAGEVAAEAGEVLESGAKKTAQAVEAGAGDLADRLEDNQREAAAEGRPGAVDPDTETRNDAE
jgi:hypothetical protein